jgi:transcriptional regulator with XRE-family HTH domain
MISAYMESAVDAPLVPRDTLAARLVMLRHELGLTVDAISAQCGLASATWSTWERGAHPRDLAAVIQKIADGTGYSRDWLMWGSTRFPLRGHWNVLEGGGVDQEELPFRPALVAVG